MPTWLPDLAAFGCLPRGPGVTPGRLREGERAALHWLDVGKLVSRGLARSVRPPWIF